MFSLIQTRTNCGTNWHVIGDAMTFLWCRWDATHQPSVLLIFVCSRVTIMPITMKPNLAACDIWFIVADCSWNVNIDLELGIYSILYGKYTWSKYISIICKYILNHTFSRNPHDFRQKIIINILYETPNITSMHKNMLQRVRPHKSYL